MIWISNLSMHLTFYTKQIGYVERISSSLDDLDIQFDYAFDMLNEKSLWNEKTSNVEGFEVLCVDLDIQFEYAFDIMNEKTSNVEGFQVLCVDLDIQFDYAFDIMNDKTQYRRKDFKFFG